MRRLAFSVILLVVTTSALAGDPVPRILIVGDSWAASIATQAVDVPGFGSFEKALTAKKMGGYKTEGSQTAWGGRKASDWVKPENLAKITSELQTYPTIDIVHLIIGGNDFLGRAGSGTSIASYTPAQRDAFWTAIAANIRTIVNHCLAQRPTIRVLISDYDYLDAAQAQTAYGFNFGGATPRQVNEAFIELGMKKLALAQEIDRCEYVSNWGVFHHEYDYPVAGLPLPGNAPDYEPYAGGDLDSTMPPQVSVGDGIHPTDEAHQVLLNRCIEQYYWQWLTESGTQPDTDDDGINDGDELRDLDPTEAGVQNPFDPTNADTTGNSRSFTPDGIPDGENDYDGDGQSNRVEFAGRLSDPLNTSSKTPVHGLPILIGLALAAAWRLRKS